MGEDSSLIEKTDRKPFLARVREVVSKRRKENKFQELLRETTAKLLNDIRESGYVAEERDDSGKYGRTFYWVNLKGEGNRKYSVLINSEIDSLLSRLEPNPEGKVVNFNLSAGDAEWKDEERRTFMLGATRLKPDEPFFLGEGASLLDIYKTINKFEYPRKKMSRKEKEGFMEELRSASVDVEGTQAAFERSKTSSPNWNIYWFRDKPTKMLPLR